MLSHFAHHCPVFIFQSLERLSDDDSKYIKNESNLFIQDWFSHKDKIESNILICHHHFIIVVILNLSSISGCGKDRLTNHIKSIGSIIGKSFFNRTHIPVFSKLDDSVLNNDSIIDFIPYKQMFKLNDSSNNFDTTIVLDVTSINVGNIYLPYDKWLLKYII